MTLGRSRVLVLGTWLYAVFFVLWLAAHLGQPTASFENTAFLPLYALAALGAFTGARRDLPRGRDVAGWRLVGLGWGASLAGALLWSLPVTGSSATWAAMLAPLLYNLYYPLLAGGFLLLSAAPTARLGRLRSVLDAVIVVLACGTIGWFFAQKGTTLNWVDQLLGGTDITVVGETTVLVAASLALHRPAALGGRLGLQILSLSAFAAGIGDMILMPAQAPALDTTRLLANATLAIGAATCATAGFLRPSVARATPVPPGSALPYLAIASVGLLVLMVLGTPGAPVDGLALGLVLLTFAVLSRLTVAEREAQHEGLTRATQDARFRSLVQHSSEALVVVDRAGTVSYASPSTPGVLGIEVQDAVGAKVAEIPAFAQAPDLLAALASPTRGAIVRWTVAAGASRRSLETVVTDLRRDPLVASLVLNTRDVSVRTRLESQLLQKQKLDALGLLAGGVAHDFNNLLMTIRANVDLALESGSPETAEELDEIGRAVEHGASLCRQMLTFSRSDPDPRVSLDLAELLGRVAPMLRRIVPRTIDLVVTPGPAVPIQTSAAGLEIALLNLVMNARDAMPAGGTLTIATSRVEVGPGDDWARDGVPCGAYAVVSVTDTGIGMDDATRVRVFEPFFTTKPLGQGTGIGLSTVHAIVTASEGHVRMSSTWGAGTTATLLFPISTATPEAPHASEVHAPGPPRHGRILLVEDEVSVRTAMARRLEREGFEIVQAGDGPQALQQLEQDAWRFDAIVTDLTMPGMNGLDLAARVRQSRRDLPIALMSGYTLGSAELRQVSIPPDVLQLTKPFKLTVLVEWLRLRLRQRGEP